MFVCQLRSIVYTWNGKGNNTKPREPISKFPVAAWLMHTGKEQLL